MLASKECFPQMARQVPAYKATMHALQWFTILLSWFACSTSHLYHEYLIVHVYWILPLCSSMHSLGEYIELPSDPYTLDIDGITNLLIII